MTKLSDLPCELLTEIARRLKKLEDYTSFRSISKPMLAVVKEDYFEGLRLRSHTPYMLLSVRDGNDDDIRELYSLVENESIVASVQVCNFKRKSCLESLGWLLVTELDGSNSLLDPFSGTEIPLPHQNTFSNYKDVEMDFFYFFQKMVLSSRPNETSDFVLMVIGGGLSELAFWRLGDKAWNKIDERVGAYCDVVYYGDGQFCAIGYPGVVWVFNLSRGDNHIESRIVTHFNSNSFCPPDRGFDSRRLYILKTMDHDKIIIITRTSPIWDVDDVFNYITENFEVFEVDMVTGTWKEIYGLGSMAVFVGRNSTVAVDASRFSGVEIKSNDIYFTEDDCIWYGHEDGQGGGKDSGVYNLETRTIEPVYPGEPLLSKVSPSTWIIPCF